MMGASSAPGDLQLPTVGDGSGIETSGRIFPEELGLALRSHAMPLEALRYDVTPTGMHYTLVHFDVPSGDSEAWNVVVDGAVSKTVDLGLAELKRRPSRTLRVTLECAGDGRALLSPRPVSQPWLNGATGTAEWTGTPLRPLLEEAGLSTDVVDVVFTGLDRGVQGGIEQAYQRALPLAEALHPDALLAWEMNGQPLEPQHGFPLRLVIPGWYGMAHVKWLRRITALTEPFGGYQNAESYRYSQSPDEQGDPVTLMRVRSLMAPPGIPDFLTRMRVVHRGQIELSGRAWSARQPISRVDVSVDGGLSWAEASVDPPPGPYAWQGWRHTWDATPGTFELMCRAADAGGAVQPLVQVWTSQGMGNNMAHRIRVQVL